MADYPWHGLLPSGIRAKLLRGKAPKLILVEHGAGQQYVTSRGLQDASSGQPDPNVTLFLAPSQRVADFIHRRGHGRAQSFPIRRRTLGRAP